MERKWMMVVFGVWLGFFRVYFGSDVSYNIFLVILLRVIYMRGDYDIIWVGLWVYGFIFFVFRVIGSSMV